MNVIILGAGGVGAMAAWQLADAGHQITVLEQFRIDHDRGSSYGDSRIVRRVYPDPLYTELMADAYTLWDELQALTPDEELFRRAGGIFCGPTDHPHVRKAQEALERAGVEHELLDACACRERFPEFALRPDETAVYEPSMGYARASRCVRAAVRQACLRGVVRIKEETSVAALEQTTAGLRVVTGEGEALQADRLLIAAGPWTGKLLTQLGISAPLQVTRQPYIHLQPTRDTTDFDASRFPVWIDVAANFYGFPRLGDVPGVKIGLHEQGDRITPETVEREVREEDRDAVRRYAALRFPGLSARVTYEKVCLYTNTPDEDFIIDAVPDLSGAFLIAGLSGHGFKFTPLLGRIGACLVSDQPIPYDLSRFRLNRFNAKPDKNK